MLKIIAPRPSTRPYAEFRFRDIEGDPLDLSQRKAAKSTSASGKRRRESKTRVIEIGVIRTMGKAQPSRAISYSNQKW